MSSSISFTVSAYDPTYSNTSTYDPFGGSVPSNAPASGSSGSSFATSAQGVAAIQSLYQLILGRAADPSGLAASQAYLGSGGSVGALQVALAHSAEAQSDINVVYRQVLGRPVDAAGLAANQAALAGGTNLTQVRSNVAHSTEASSDINGIFGSILARPVDASSLGGEENALASGQTLAQLRSSVAYSAEAQNDINVFYESVLGRPVDSGGLGTYQAQLAGGAGLGSVRAALAYSPEAVGDLDNVIRNVQGRAPTPGDTAWIAAQQQALASGTETLAQVQSNLATYSGEAGVLANVIGNVQGRAATAADAPWIQAQEQAIASGATVAQITSSLAYYSGEVSVLDNVIQAVQGRTAEAYDTPWIQAQQQSLANGSSIAQITASLANYSGEVGVLANVIQTVQGRTAGPSDTPWIQAQQQAIANGETLAQVTSNLAYYPGEADVLDNAIQDVQGRLAGTSDTPWIQAQEAGLANGTLTVASITQSLATFVGEQTILSNAFDTLLGQTLPSAQLSAAEQTLATGGNTVTVAAQIVNSSACYQDCLSELGQVEDASAATTDAPREQTFILDAVQAASNTWTSAVSTIESAAMNFLNQINPIGSADASTLPPSQLYAQDLATSQTPNVAAALATIEYCEGGGDVSFGGGAITNLSQFPTTGIKSASGLFQIVRRTYNNFAAKLGITDFSHTSQIVVATEILRYQGVVAQLQGNNATAAFQMAAGVGGAHWNAAPGNGQLWAALPGGVTARYTMSQVLSYYHAQGGTGN